MVAETIATVSEASICIGEFLVLVSHSRGPHNGHFPSWPRMSFQCQCSIP